MEQSEVVGALAALAHETRLQVFRLLVQAGPTGLAAGTLAETLDIPSPTLSFHLKELRRAGLVDSDRVGRSVIYQADYPTMSELLAFLTDRCCEGAVEHPPLSRKVTR